jgi:hypothetical protein
MDVSELDARIGVPFVPNFAHMVQAGHQPVMRDHHDLQAFVVYGPG